MKIRINTLIILILFLFACKEDSKNTEPELLPKTSIKLESTLEPESETDRDLSKSAELFVKEILNENFREQFLDFSVLKKTKHHNIFLAEGLEKIVAYSNKNYPNKTEPKHYEQFILYVATYRDIKSAQAAFGQIKLYSKYKLGQSINLDQEKSIRVSSLNIGAKPGGMITQNGKQIFSLVETCRETPIRGKWIDYEAKFIGYITEKRREIEVLNSDCGNNQYRVQRRKASSQQNL